MYAAEHGTAEEKETEDHSRMLEDELEQMEESLLDEFVSDRSISYQERQNWEKSSVS